MVKLSAVWISDQYLVRDPELDLVADRWSVVVVFRHLSGSDGTVTEQGGQVRSDDGQREADHDGSRPSGPAAVNQLHQRRVYCASRICGHCLVPNPRR
jgi:hypothetical protein